MANSFLIRSVSLRAWNIQNWMCLSFSASVGKLHLSASPRIRSTNSSRVSPAFILISSSWYILHCWEKGWSMELCRNSIKSLALFLFFSHFTAVLPEGFHCSCFLLSDGTQEIEQILQSCGITSLVRYTLECVPALHPLNEETRNLQTVLMSSSWRLEVSGNLSVNPWYLSKSSSKPWWWPP